MIAAALFSAALLIQLVPAQPNAVPCRGVVHAQRADGTKAETSAGDLRIDLAPGEWTLTLESETCWAPDVPVRVAPDGGTATLPVWPRTEYSGALKVRGNGAMPASVEAEFRPAGQRSARTQACPVREGVWTCSGPRAETDIKLRASGFAPIYFWGVGKTKLPPALLERGASVIGWVQRPDRTPAADAEVEVAADTFASQSRVRFAVDAGSARTNARGFFQVRGLPPGRYTVRARTKNKDASPIQTIDVHDEAEHVAGDIRLEPAAVVDVRIEPPRSPAGTPWRLGLDRVTIGGLVRGEPTASSDDGRWTQERVERGRYRLRVLDDRGWVMQAVDVDVDRDLVPLQVRVGAVRVEGRVRNGTEPVAAKLRFDSVKGNAELQSDDDGLFEGWLPAEGKWRVQIAPRDLLLMVRMEVDVRVSPEKGKATVDLELPAGQVRGVVDDGKGQPVSEAEVLALRGNTIIANAGTAADGSFTMFGLGEGDVELVAQKGRLESPRVRYAVSPAPQTARLVLASRQRISGTARMANGRPVVGALIRYLVAGNLQSTVSGPSGDFEFDLPPSVPYADLVVLAPGLPVRIARLDVDAPSHDLVLSGQAGVLRIKPRPDGSMPAVRYGPTMLPLSFLLMPAEGFGLRESDGDAIRLAVEPGTYSVCHRDACTTHDVTAGAEVLVGGSK